MIRCRGRNGSFTFDHFCVFVGQFESKGYGWVEIFSNSPHTGTAPITFQGPPLEVVRLLRKIARELEADYRAAKQKRGA